MSYAVEGFLKVKSRNPKWYAELFVLFGKLRDDEQMVVASEAGPKAGLISRLGLVQRVLDSGVDDIGEDFVDYRDYADRSVIAGVQLITLFEQDYKFGSVPAAWRD